MAWNGLRTRTRNNKNRRSFTRIVEVVRTCGVTSEVTASPNALVAQSIKEHSDAVVAVLNQEQPDFVKAHTEIVQAEVALLRLKNWVKAEMRMEVDREFDVIARR